MPTLYGDIESRSKSVLKKSGSYRYCADPSTEPLFLCWAVDTGEIQTWRQGDPVPAPFFAAEANPADWNVVVHNYFFELPFFELILAPRFGFPIIPLEAWHCTMRLALANARPAELGLLAQSLGLPYTKDAKAVKALREVCRPKKDGGWDETPAKLELVHQRCITDVGAARAIWLHPDLRHLDEFVTAARDFATAERNGINTRLYELTDGAISTIDQVQKLRAVINARGHEMETLGKRAVATVLASDPDEVTKQLLELRRDGARSSVRKFAKILDFADANDDRLRGTLTMYGASTGRWTAPGPMLHNLKRNELGVPLSVLDAVIRNDRPYIAQFGSPLTVLSNISRGMLVARSGHLLYSGDYRMIESRVLAWGADEEWKLQLHRDYDRTGDRNLEPYRVLASQMLNRPIKEIGANERQQGKFAELSAGYGGGVGAWRRIFDDRRPDAEIEADKIKWRNLHPKIVMFWHRLFRAVRIAVQMGAAVRVNEPPLPEIVCYFEAGTLYISLPSGRCLTFPGARLVPGKFEGSVDLAYFDNSKKQWRETRAWYGMIVENVVSGIARDLLAAAIVRFEARGLPVVFHWHDDCVCEIPAGTITDAEFLAILIEPPSWAAGLPLAGSVHSGLHYLPASDEPVAKPVPIKTAPVEIVTDAAPAPVLEQAIEQALDELIAEPASIDYSPAELRTFAKDDAKDELENLAEHAAPLYEIAELAITTGSAKVICPFHAESSPSCLLYADHFHCFGCGAHGSRMDWLTEVEGLTKTEAAKLILEWDGDRKVSPFEDKKTANTARALALWNGGKPIAGTWAERYLAETRKIAVERLPDSISDSLRFYDQCPFVGTKHPCLLALMTDPVTGEPCGIHRIALAESAGKVDRIDRRALGAMGVVRLWPANGRLIVGEGIETTLAAATRIPYHGAPLTPAWAAVSDHGMRCLPALEGIAELILLVDHDHNGAGQNAAMVCEQRWRAAGRDVLQLLPHEPGFDFNDVVIRRSA